MKSIILTSIVAGMMSTSLLASENWIDPSSDCPARSGDGACSASWTKAAAICESLGARLPTLNELRKEVENCGGEINAIHDNSRNEAYQLCYKNLGFSSSSSYWSSSIDVSDSNRAWYMGFHLGNERAGDKSNVTHLRCTKQ